MAVGAKHLVLRVSSITTAHEKILHINVCSKIPAPGALLTPAPGVKKIGRGSISIHKQDTRTAIATSTMSPHASPSRVTRVRSRTRSSLDGFFPHDCSHVDAVDQQDLRMFTRSLRLAKRQLLLMSVEDQASPVDRLRKLLLRLSFDPADDGENDMRSSSLRTVCTDGDSKNSDRLSRN
jgi:hypothetical protein